MLREKEMKGYAQRVSGTRVSGGYAQRVSGLVLARRRKRGAIAEFGISSCSKMAGGTIANSAMRILKKKIQVPTTFQKRVKSRPKES